MHLELLAIPAGVPGLREGARLRVRPGEPVAVGPSLKARLRLGGAGADLTLCWAEGGVLVRSPPSAPRASVDGVELEAGEERLVPDGGCLCVHPGLVLRAQERPPVEAREPGLEAALHRQAGELSGEALAVYRDFLEERGDPLAAWLARFPGTSGAERRAALGALADAHRGGLLSASYGPEGFLERVALARQATTQAPGLRWHLTQLARLPVARFLRQLSVGLLAGPLRPEADAEVAQLLELVGAAPFAPGLRQLSLGFTAAPTPWPLAQAVWARLSPRLPGLPEQVGQLVRRGGPARLLLLQRPPGVEVVALEVRLHPQRTDVGAAPTCLVRVVGAVPPVLCSLHRETDGQWTVWDEGADPFRQRGGRFALRVNGALQRRATLEPGDVLEPLEGLRFEFQAGR